MIKISNGDDFKKILLGYDIFLFDMMGVVWSGNKKIVGTDETLEFLKENNKTNFFLSNSPILSESLKFEFEEMGIYQGKHYDGIVASGDVLNSVLKNKTIHFKNNKNPENCYIFGVFDDDMMKNISYRVVDSIKEADFVILGFPQLTLDEYNKLDEKYKNEVFESVMYKQSYYDSTNINVFMDKINEIKAYNLPVINNCADTVAMQPSKNSSALHYVIRHGAIANKLRELGAEVIETSKPYSIIYDLVFDKISKVLNCEKEELKNKKILMIGDTINTDILGATNATKDLNIKVNGMLTLCGVSGRDFKKNTEEIIKYCDEKSLNLNHIIDDLGVILK